ncbi:MAG: hypothetical protein A3B68_05200 [Candidatus Melainabacteria bacterium RIFCSPHIGHO2_02_FULL_34_12]|nr:MAG: hypothetical protein A3B68_05200 [Candidatus Melainabacteria bacterium RIFCSPHIGHO2_02_FULL_34_12]
MTLRTIFNAVVPNRLYIPKFKPDTVIVSDGDEGKRNDMPRFGNDTRLAVTGQSPFLVHSIARGNYTSSTPQAEFEHDSVAGTPHYELEALTTDGFQDNYLVGRSVNQNSRFFIAASLADSRFHTPEVVTARKAA